MNIPKKYTAKIESELQYCEGCQPRDNEEIDGFFWILGDRIQFSNYLYDIDVPEKYHTDIDGKFRCPNCGDGIGLYNDIGLKSKYEKEYDKKFMHVASKISPAIEDFTKYLKRYPYLGAKHPVGKRIYKEIRELSRIDVINEIWYRGRSVNESRIYENNDMYPPEPEKVTIGEGRFNHYGQSHYYLGDSEEVCSKEINYKKKSLCWLQKLKIKKVENIIDLSGYLNQDNIDNIPMIFCGIMNSGAIARSVLRDKTWKPEYFVPRFISDVCKENGINGIKYNSTVSYGDNLVIFDLLTVVFSFLDYPYIYKMKDENLLF